MSARPHRRARCGLIAVLIGALAIVPLGARPARAAEPEVRTYVVQPGDSVWSIAAEFYGSGDKYPIIYQYNDFAAKPPFILKPGQVLRLPILGQGPEAQLEWLLRDVKAKPPRSLDWLVARQNMNLWRLYRVATGDESAARIVFEDTSDLKLRENALLVIYGASASAARRERRDKVEIMLEEGTIQGSLAKLDEGQKPMIVKTPSGEVALLAKLAQVQAEVTASIVSVFDGAATVKAQGAAVDVKTGEGTVVKKGKKPEAPRPLPPAPQWLEAAPAVVVSLGGRAVQFEAAWQPVARAATYRVELATDATFQKMLYDAEIGAGVTRLRLAALAPGKYAVRVSTRDADKLESTPGPARLVDVVAVQPQRAFAETAAGVVEAVGFLQMEIEPAMQADTFHRVDEQPEVAGGTPIRLATAGLHTVTLRRGEATAVMAVEVIGVSGTIESGGEAHDWRAVVPLTLTVRDARGRPALLPGLTLETSSGEVLPLIENADGYRAVVPARARYERVAVRATWLGGELASEEIGYAAPRVGRAPSDADRELDATVPSRTHRLAPGPWAGTRPESRLALDVAGAGGGDDDVLAIALAGEVALGGLGLGAHFVAQDVRLSEGDDGQSKVHDLSLVLRYGFGDEDARFTPYLRAALPVGPGHEDRVFGVEPGVAFRLSGEALFLEARAALLALAHDVGTPLVGDALLALGWKLGANVALDLSAETLFGDDAHGGWRHIVGLGTTLGVGDVHLGATLGVGLGERDATLGAIIGRFVLDVRL